MAENDTETQKYLSIHLDLYDSTLRQIIEESLTERYTKTHRVAKLIKVDDKNWLIRLEYDIRKASKNDK